MFFLPIALVTAGAAALLNFWLGLRVSRLRISEKILVGDGGNPRLLARMRAQLNFAEYAPLVLILIALVELARGTQAWLWGVALVFIVGRILHAFGMDGWRPGRMIGIATTMLTMLGLAAYAVYLGYTGLNPLR
ncbi:MAPEG family protein [Sphingomonas sp. UNC305MFCol5.2]|uniref:MAPEG family protein n=1 Tax=Sphingomonas sp. UNC305MFCol5.2 TaxID=1449076 RepID=UPI0004A75184|nr:MAPEG family protein [Sphingomonas sp. UNC305MFCol5.2]